MARLLRMLPSCCPSRTAVLQRALFSSVLNHTKKRVWCQTGLLVPLGVEHGFENGTYYSWCLLLITKRHLYLKLPKTDLKGREESCNHRSSQSDMKVMAEILDFMPGFRCQISPPDTEVLPVISLLGSLQSWGTASRVGERKTSPTPDIKKYLVQGEWEKRQGLSRVLQSCLLLSDQGSSSAPPLALTRRVCTPSLGNGERRQALSSKISCLPDKSWLFPCFLEGGRP